MKALNTAGAAALGAAALALLSGVAHADINLSNGDTIVFAASGSSAQFNAFELAAATQAGGTELHYSAKNAGFVKEVKVAGVPNENGNLWVIWTGGPGTYHIWFDLSVDSTVGNRAFFNSDTLGLANPLPAGGVGGTNGASGVATLSATDQAALPAQVAADINGVVFNAGLTDIRPEDAVVATARSLSLGYGVGNPITGADGKIATPVPFVLNNRSFTVSALGAVPIVVFVNNTDAALKAVTNVNRFTLGRILNGAAFRESDLDTTAAPNAAPNSANLTTFIREPLSGTYNTTEFCIPGSVEVNTTQEAGVSSNPLNEAGITLQGNGTLAAGSPASNGGRVRVIGTGDMVNAVNSTTDSIGYAFWNTANFTSGVAGNTHYLTVDGVDPLVANYPGAGGDNYPTGGNVTFTNIINGGYPAWSLLRVVTDAALPNDLTLLIGDAQNEASGGDFAKPSSLHVFRSHRGVPALLGNAAVSPNNGVNSEGVETGSDVGGAVFSLNNEANNENDFGTEITGVRQ